MPEISVIIPTFNYAHYIKEAIKSVISQTYTDFEIIVIDDGSTDDTKEVLQAYIRTNVIKYIYQKNKGLAAARNTGISSSTGRFITFLDSDDLFTKDKLQLLRTALVSHPDAGMAYGNHILWVRAKLYKKPKFSPGTAPSGWILPQLFRNALMSVPSVMVRRECFERIGLFNESLTTTEDWEMWMRIAAEYKVVYVDKIIAYVRVHPDSMSRDFIKMGENKMHIQKSIYFKYQTLLLNTFSQDYIDGIFALTYVDLAKHQLIQGSPKISRRYLKCAFGLDSNIFLKTGWLFPASFLQPLVKLLYRLKMKIINYFSISQKNLNIT